MLCKFTKKNNTSQRVCKENSFIIIHSTAVLCDFYRDFMAAAEGGVDAVVELHEGLAAEFETSGCDVGAEQDAAVEG